MEGKKILFITNQLSYTGAPLALLNVIKICLKIGIQVDVISLAEGQLRTEFEEILIKPEIWEGIICNSERFMQVVSDFDLVIANTLPAFEAIHLINRTGVPAIWWIHEGENYFELLNTVLPDIGKLNKNIKILSVSEVVADIIKIRYGINTDKLIPMTEDISMGDEIEQVKKPIFLNVGHPSVLKGQDILIKAIYALPTKIREKCEFVFAGVNETDNEVLKLLDRAKKDFNNIKIFPMMKKFELMKLIAKSAFITVSSRSETVSLAAAEGMMLSKPCIITEKCGAAGYMTDGEDSFIIKINDEKEMLEALLKAVKIFENKDKYKVMCLNARETYKKYFSKEKFETEVLKIIDDRLYKEKLMSVIILCKNDSKCLPGCFVSLVKQTIGIRNIELIFIDNSSDDGGAPWRLLNEMERAYPENVAVIGLNKSTDEEEAKNIALSYAGGKYTAFVDTDTYIPANFLLELYRNYTIML